MNVLIIYIISICCISILIGEILHQCSKKKKENSHINVKKKTSNNIESIENPFGRLKTESIDLVSTSTLQMRGSWRIAKNRVLNLQQVEQMMSYEYSKKL